MPKRRFIEEKNYNTFAESTENASRNIQKPRRGLAFSKPNLPEFNLRQKISTILLARETKRIFQCRKFETNFFAKETKISRTKKEYETSKLDRNLTFKLQTLKGKGKKNEN